MVCLRVEAAFGMFAVMTKYRHDLFISQAFEFDGDGRMLLDDIQCLRKV